MIDLAGNLKRIRKAHGWTQQKLAEEAKISYGIVTKIEQGSSKEPTIGSLVKLADALSVTLDDLVGRVLPHKTAR
jgi:transcriptional regulator with XRE-family HTH domain